MLKAGFEFLDKDAQKALDSPSFYASANTGIAEGIFTQLLKYRKGRDDLDNDTDSAPQAHVGLAWVRMVGFAHNFGRNYDIAEGLKLEPVSPELHFLAGLFETNQCSGPHDAKAVEHFDAAIASAGDKIYADAIYWKGLTLDRNPDNAEQALASLEKAVAHDPQNQAYKSAWFYSLCKHGKSEIVLENEEKSGETDDRIFSSHYSKTGRIKDSGFSIAYAKFQAEDYAGARESLEGVTYSVYTDNNRNEKRLARTLTGLMDAIQGDISGIEEIRLSGNMTSADKAIEALAYEHLSHWDTSEGKYRGVLTEIKRDITGEDGYISELDKQSALFCAQKLLERGAKPHDIENEYAALKNVDLKSVPKVDILQVRFFS